MIFLENVFPWDLRRAPIWVTDFMYKAKEDMPKVKRVDPHRPPSATLVACVFKAESSLSAPATPENLGFSLANQHEKSTVNA